MKRILLTLIAAVSALQITGQCSLIEVSLAQRASASDLIVEGKVIAKNSYWDAEHKKIYTANRVEVYKIFKGSLAGTEIEVLTEGGTVGNYMIRVEPSLELNLGDVGVFTCETVKRFKVPVSKSAVPQYEAYASVQGFIKYDLVSLTAAEPFRVYTDINAEVYKALLSSKKTWQTVIPFDIYSNASTNKSGPYPDVMSISGFSPTTVTAGTGTTITITGTNFGATQGSGVVRFRNADDGGSTTITPLASQYVSWSNTQIVVEVPQNAGTGTIQVVQGQTFTSSQTLTVSYAHLNVDFDPGSGTIAYETDHINDNGSGGYTWRMNTGFDGNASAKASFLRAFDTWRCNTGVNWTIGATTSINDAVSDGTNIICFDNTAPLSAGILGVCYSYWSGCASGPTIIWYVNELDIIFDDGSNISPLTWEYGPAAPSGSEYDFETVAVHELGHGHQLGHVISPGAIMHYAISNGSSNRSLGTNDQAGGDYVQAKSIVANVCGPGAMSNYSCITPPVADFSGSPTTLCAGNTVSFTDLSTNAPTSWAWTFTGGTPSSSTAQNPTITYNTPGTYAVTLVATNAGGSDTKTVSGYITVNSCGSPPVADFSGTPTNLCAGGTVSFSDLSTNTPTSWAWTFAGGTPSSSTSQNPSVTYNTPGTYAVTLVATNGSGSDTKTVNGYITVNANPSASGTVTHVSCNGGSNGAINLSPSGGQSPYTFLWNPSGQTTEDRTSLTAGTYSVTVTDANGCTVQNSFNVTQPSALSVTMSKTDATCANNDGTATATPSGGTSPYTYVWTPGGQTIQTATGLSAATYTCMVTDNNGCTVSGNITVGMNCGVPNTQLAPAYCGITLTSLNQQVYCVAVTNANNYQYRVNGTNVSNYVYTRGNYLTNFDLTLIPGVQYGATYSVEVRARVGTTWGAYSTVCTLTTPAVIPSTQLQPAYCGITLSSLSQQVYCDAVTGASNYQYRLNGPGLTNYVYTRGNNLTNFAMSWVTGAQYGGTYSVEVRSYVGGIWSAYGAACNLTTPAFPTTQLSAPYCGITLSTMSQQVNCDAVIGASNYQYRLNGPNLTNYVYTRGNNLTNFAMSWVTGVQLSSSYSVEVRAYVGGVWGSYGPVCTVTTPANSVPMDDLRVYLLHDEQETLINVFPNPFADMVSIKAGSPITGITVMNIMGDKVYSVACSGSEVQLNLADLVPGIYLVYIETSEGIHARKMIKK
ncbi:MAG: PKD domain-containing protein [Bacteroidota bacterium]